MSNTRFALIYWSIVAAIFVVVYMILLGNLYAWTGFGDYTESTLQGQEVVRGKTLWDWMELLIVPVTLAAGGAWFTSYQRQRDHELAERNRQRDEELAERNKQRDIAIAERNAQERALQIYLEQMTQLLAENKLVFSGYPSTPNVARVWTLSTLRRVTSDQKAIVLRFLQESRLILSSDPLVNLEDADLREVNLDSADLSHAALPKAQLDGAQLQHALLNGANLRGSSLSNSNPQQASLNDAALESAQLVGTCLAGASLNRAKLQWANLSGTDFRGALLNEADLSSAILTGANLKDAILRGAILKGSVYARHTLWPDGFDPVAAGARLDE